MRRRANEGRIDPDLSAEMLGHPHQERLLDLLRLTRGMGDEQVASIINNIRGAA